MLSHNRLAIVYKNNFDLARYHHWNISEIERLLPFERDIYIDMYIAALEEEKENAKQ